MTPPGGAIEQWNGQSPDRIMKRYRVRFTRPAEVEAIKRGLSLKQLEAYIRHEMDSEGYHGGDDARCYPPDLIFHTVDCNDPKPWLITGESGDLVTVDSATYEESAEPFDEGPLKGLTYVMAKGDDDDC